MSFDLSKCPRNEQGHYLCQTIGGREVRIVCTDAISGKDRNFPIIALVACDEGYETVRWYQANGRLVSSSAGSGDLINTPRKVKRWINVPPKCGDSALLYVDENTAKGYASICGQQTIAIEWEEMP